MEDIKTFFKNRKNLISVLALGILILALPLGISLLQRQQIIKSRAAGVDPITFVAGANVKQKGNGAWIATKSQNGKYAVSLQLTSPLGPPVGAVIEPLGTSEPTVTPTPTATPRAACNNPYIFGFNGPVTDKIKQLFTHPSLRFIPVAWKSIQPNQGAAFDFTSTDKDINDAIADGQTPAVKFCDGDCFPDWVRQMSAPIDNSYCCSSEYVCRVLKDDAGVVQVFKDVVYAMVSRYKDKVTYWDYGIEPNCRGYNPVRYTGWLKYFSEAVRSAEPSAVVVGGHLSGANTNYLVAMYGHGAQPYFDRLALDPYGEPFDYAGVDNIRNIMVNQGDANKKIWLGEWGLPTNNDEAKQARLIGEGLDYLASKPWIEAAFYHNFECELWTSSCSPGTPGYLGFSLVRSNGTAKQAYDVFQSKSSSCQ